MEEYKRKKMVVICNKPFDQEQSAGGVNSYWGCGGANPHKLSDFQQWALKAIQEGDNVLITAHTGSGKTLPAEYAIQYFTARGKKVIYASPIKALSNQKLYDMRRKFPAISFGILTGDCKDNPEAEVLIMTTEILRNTLLNKRLKATGTGTGTCMPLLFEMDFDTELAAVVFDEVHYINDAERGAVWEQAILLLPPQVQLILLSATIDRPEEFAGWIETEKRVQAEQAGLKVKQIYLASTAVRVVPLTHYMWFSVHEGTLKKAAKTPYEKKIEQVRHIPLPLLASNTGTFCQDHYYKIHEVKEYLTKNNAGYIKRQFVLAELLTYLKSQGMLPAICFIFSRKHVEQAAHEISFSLYEEDSLLPTQVEKECRHILQAKLPNYLEYLQLPEYLSIVKLLEKGVGIHHAGILPVLREMVELLFEKGYIRLLLATETFAVGLNMPTKTVIFTGLTKFNGHGMRLLFPHEYTQMAGRAGRRGLDTVGHVFHCVNLFDLPTVTDYRHMLTGPPQTLVSKFKISFPLALSMCAAKQDMTAFMSQSLLSVDLRRELSGYAKEADQNTVLIQNKQAQMALGRTPVFVLEAYTELTGRLPGLANSARKKVRTEMTTLEAEHKFLIKDLVKFAEYQAALAEQTTIGAKTENTANYIQQILNALQKILVKEGFLTLASDSDSSTSASDSSSITNVCVTSKGQIAAQLQEVHPLVMAEMYQADDALLADLSAAELAGLFSCFYPVAVNDEMRAHRPIALCNILQTVADRLAYYEKAELAAMLETGATYNMYYDLLPFVLQWCESEDEIQCKGIIQELKVKTGLFIGEFVKALLKVNAVAMEFERVCELTGNVAFLEKLRSIPKLTLKYIATSQSLYL